MQCILKLKFSEKSRSIISMKKKVFSYIGKGKKSVLNYHMHIPSDIVSFHRYPSFLCLV
jgi:hypothetical protein